MRTFVIGDIHGAYKALEQVIERSGIDRKKDHLICLGDVCDGWPEVNKCFDELLTFDNLTYILGNHDAGPSSVDHGWALSWMKYGDRQRYWVTQGGQATIESYGNDHLRVPQAHKDLLDNAKLYYVQNDNLFVHGGVQPGLTLAGQEELSPYLFYWDRAMYFHAKTGVDVPQFNKVFCGHTQHQYEGPHYVANVVNMDTSAGWDGVLTIMDVGTEEYWTSDNVLDLYPYVTGRSRRR